MKKDIVEFVAKCPNYQQVINMDFITGLQKSCSKHDSIWFIVMTKSVHFLSVKTTHSAEDYAKFYI